MLCVDDIHFGKDYFERCFARFEGHAVLGRPEGLRVAVRLADPAFWIALCCYMKERGGSVFPLPSDTPVEGARRNARRSGSDFLLFGTEGVTALDSMERIAQSGATNLDARPPGLIQTSSGTTGDPKFIDRSWTSIDAEIASYLRHFDDGGALRPIVACPVNHSYGLISGVLVALARGVVPTVVSNLNPKYLLRKLYETTSPLLYSSPTLIATITMLAPEEKPIFAVMTSGSLMNRTWFSGVRRKVRHLHQQYGCSEAGCVVLGQDIEAPNELGTPLSHVELIAGRSANEPGEIVLKFGGDATIATRDLGYLEGGRLYFVSRLDDMINVSGINVYPGEVEEVVLQMPGVVDAVCFRRKHGFGNDQVCLRFVANEDLAERAVREWCAQSLASHQVPTVVKRVDAIPRLPNGKISRKALAEDSVP